MLENLCLQKFIYNRLVKKPRVSRFLDCFGKLLNKAGIQYATGRTRAEVTIFCSYNPFEIHQAYQKLEQLKGQRDKSADLALSRYSQVPNLYNYYELVEISHPTKGTYYLTYGKLNNEWKLNPRAPLLPYAAHDYLLMLARGRDPWEYIDTRYKEATYSWRISMPSNELKEMIGNQRARDYHSRQLLEALGRKEANPADVMLLELGCGSGWETRKFLNFHLIAVDISEEACSETRTRGIEKVICADARNLPFEPASIDIVHSGRFINDSADTINALDDPNARWFWDNPMFSLEVNRVLRIGGVFAVRSLSQADFLGFQGRSFDHYKKVIDVPYKRIKLGAKQE